MSDTLPIGRLRLGKVDGKHEYLAPASDRDHLFFDAFLLPETVDPARLHNGDCYFIEGYRGTGKTSLLRWHAEQRKAAGCKTEFILFKSDLTDSQRMSISKEVGIDWTDIDPKSMEIAQDFKAAWTWFIHHKIGELIKSNPNIVISDPEKYLKVLGLADPSVFSKVVGFMPKLEGANVKIKADVGFFELELGGDFKKEGDNAGRATLDSLAHAATRMSLQLAMRSTLFIYFDELEVFYSVPEQYRRDQRMVRDLLFSIGALNDQFRHQGIQINLIAAVRSEVVDGMGSLGQEVDRLVHDKGFVIAWHHARRSLDHPLVRMIGRKLKASEEAEKFFREVDPLIRYFPQNVDGLPIDAALLDRSFYKPRDLVWRLSLAQKLFPSANNFSIDVLHDTEGEYSSKLWDEIRYELSAVYSEMEIDVVEMVLSGGQMHFDLSDAEARFSLAAKRSADVAPLLDRRAVADILADLYRLGAIGNAFRAGSSGGDIRNRWAFRGDPTLLVDKRMTIHPALMKRLSAVATRRRGSRGTGR